MADIAAVVLAAGKASRYRQADPFAATKVVALYNGEPMVRRAVRAALGAAAYPVVVVTGCEPEAVREALAGEDVRFAHNEAFESGIASSIRTGLEALPLSVRGAFILLGDMPLVDAVLLRRLVAAFDAVPGAAAAVPVHGGTRGNPVLLADAMFARAKDLTGDEGARRILRDPALQVVEVPSDEAAAIDIDTPEALRQVGTAPRGKGDAG